MHNKFISLLGKENTDYIKTLKFELNLADETFKIEKNLNHPPKA